MKLVEFNGLGQPRSENVKEGALLVLYEPGVSIEIVQLHLLPPDEFGPELLPTEYPKEIEAILMERIHTAHPECKNNDRHWIFSLPDEFRVDISTKN